MILLNLMAKTEYTLIEIIEDEVPLANAPQSSNMLFWLWLVILALAVGIVCYLVRCIQYRRRIAELQEGRTAYQGWSLPRLKETVQELEYDKVSRMELLI